MPPSAIQFSTDSLVNIGLDDTEYSFDSSESSSRSSTYQHIELSGIKNCSKIDASQPHQSRAKRFIRRLFPSPTAASSSSSASSKESPSLSSANAGDLICAIQKNSVQQVKQYLETGADPNALLVLTGRHKSIDMIFLWKRIFGESATPVHIAIINVYHHSTRSKRGQMDKALEIFELMLQYGGDVSTRNTNMFLGVSQTRNISQAVSPMDLVQGLKRLVLITMASGGNAEAALDAALHIMRRYYRQNVLKMDQGKNSRKLPFNFISCEEIDKMRVFVFSSLENVTPDEAHIRFFEHI